MKTLASLLLLISHALFGQLGAPNASGVSRGHVHLTFRNPEVHRKLWLLKAGDSSHVFSRAQISPALTPTR